MTEAKGNTEETDTGAVPVAAETAGEMRERSRELQKRGLWYHVVLFIGGTMILVSANLILTPGLLWVVPVTVLWVFVLLWHAWQVFGKARG